MSLLGRLKGWLGAAPAAEAPKPASTDAAVDGEAERRAGNAALQASRLDDALVHYERFAALQPGHAPAHLNRGYALQRLGRLAEAATAFRRAADLDPASHEARFFLAKARIEQDNLFEAEPLLAEAVALQPEFVHGWLELGIVRERRKAPGPARKAFERATEIAPELAPAWEGIARTALVLEDAAGSLAAAEKAQQLQPGAAQPMGMRADALVKLGRAAEGLELVEAALALRPDWPALLFVRGSALHELGRYDQAVEMYRRCLLQQPNDAVFNIGLGISLAALDRYDEAGAALEKARTLDPDSVAAVVNSAFVYQQQLRFDDMFRLLREAIERWPENAMLRFYQSKALFHRHEMAEAWKFYEARDKTTIGGVEIWRPGQPVTGRRVLLLCDQGLGDTVHFARYVPEVMARGASVALCVQPRLKRLFEGVWPECELVTDAKQAQGVEMYCVLTSLPHVLGMAEPLTMTAPYIRPAADRLQYWRQRLGSSPGRPVVGIVWSGNASHVNDRRRSMSLEQIHAAALGRRPRFVSLQFEVRDSDRAVFAAWPDLLDVGAEQQDMADTAALLEVLDAVLCVDTSICHVAGALGRPAYVMLHQCPDWRWGSAGDTTPWYPSMRLFRQEQPGDWAPAVRRALDALDELPVRTPV